MVLIALDEADVGGAIVRHSFLIVLAGVVLALALAFGLGGQRLGRGVPGALVARSTPQKTKIHRSTRRTQSDRD